MGDQGAPITDLTTPEGRILKLMYEVWASLESWEEIDATVKARITAAFTAARQEGEREGAVRVWEVAGALAESGIPPEGIAYLAQQNAAALRPPLAGT